jgi:hypothetical protein
MEEQKSPRVRCFFDHIITTVNKKKTSVILNTPDEILTRQIVLVAGPEAGVVPGEEVEIDVSKFQRKNVGPKQIGAVNDIGPDKFVIIPPIEIIDETPYLFLSRREIKYVYLKDE